MNTMRCVFDQLSSALLEREEAINAILIGLVAKEHVLLVGPPGTAKSALCRAVSTAINDIKYCERLLSPTTPPEELFGPVSMQALKEDRYEHVLTNSIADAHLVFLDEFFRCNDAILDTLLHLLGPERQALIGSKQTKIPLISAIAATNTWPDSQHQQAIFDRWLIRLTVRPLSQDGLRQLLFQHQPIVQPCCTLNDLIQAQETARKATLSAAAQEAMTNIIEELSSNGIRPSDRRYHKSLNAAKAAAAIDGSQTVEPHHLEILSHILWDSQQQADKASDIITKIANPSGAAINDCLKELGEVLNNKGQDTSSMIISIKKIEDIENKLKAHSSNPRAAKAIDYAQRQKLSIHARMLGISEEKAKLVFNK